MAKIGRLVVANAMPERSRYDSPASLPTSEDARVTQAIDWVFLRAVERGDIAGATAVAVNRDGTIYEGAFGRQRPSEAVDMRLDSVFQIASMTKGLVSVAALQLVEDGRLSLDAPAADVLPELAALSVLQDDGTLRPAARPVTLRQLLSHTSGFGYAFTSKRLAGYLAAGVAAGAPVEAPLLFEPGERWQYGTSTEWVGQLIVAAGGLPLDDYMQRYVIAPLGMGDTGYAISDGQAARMVSSHRRLADGTLQETPFVRPPVRVSGGGGMISTAPDFARFLRLMLTDGELDGHRVLQPTSVRGLSTNQIGDIVAGQWETGDAERSNDLDFSDAGSARWSLGFLLSQQDAPGRRRAGSVSWGGIQNTYYWIDPQAGVAGVIFTQVLPFGDPTCLRVYEDFERAVYTTVR